MCTLGRRIGLIGIAFAAAACRAPTEITITITTDECARDQGTTLTIGHLVEIETKPPSAVTSACSPDGPDGGRVGSLVVVPSGADDDTVGIRVVLGVGKDPATCVAPLYGKGCIVARRALRYIPHQSLQLPIVMSSSCDGIACAEDQTCVAGACQSATIPDPGACLTPEGCALAGDGGIVDASLSDTKPPAEASACAEDASFVSDPHNCGACGHDCQGGGCASGQCQPFVLASGLSAPIHVTSDVTNVYFTTNEANGGLYQCPKTGCGGGPTALATGQMQADRVLFSGGAIYWTDNGDGVSPNGAVQSCVPPCTGGPVTLAANVVDPTGIAVAGTTLYFASGVRSTGTINTCPLAGCVGAPTTIATGQDDPAGLTLGAGHLFWANLGSPSASTGSIAGCAASTCNAVVALGSLAYPAFVATDDTNVYFTVEGIQVDNYAEGALMACPAAGCAGAPTVLATGLTQAEVLVLDGPDIYVSVGGLPGGSNGEIVRCAKTGCGGTPTVLANGLREPWGLTTDATTIYWVEYEGGRLVKLAK